MAIKLNSDGSKELIELNGKIDNSFFAKTWIAAQLVQGNKAFVFNVRAKQVKCALNKNASEMAGCNLYGIVYIIHPDMVTSRIKKISKNDVILIDQDAANIGKVMGTERKKMVIAAKVPVQKAAPTPSVEPEPVKEPEKPIQEKVLEKVSEEVIEDKIEDMKLLGSIIDLNKRIDSKLLQLIKARLKKYNLDEVAQCYESLAGMCVEAQQLLTVVSDRLM